MSRTLAGLVVLGLLLIGVCVLAAQMPDSPDQTVREQFYLYEGDSVRTIAHTIRAYAAGAADTSAPELQVDWDVDSAKVCYVSRDTTNAGGKIRSGRYDVYSIDGANVLVRDNLWIPGALPPMRAIDDSSLVAAGLDASVALKDASITAAKIDTGAVTSEKMADGSVTGAKMADAIEKDALTLGASDTSGVEILGTLKVNGLLTAKANLLVDTITSDDSSGVTISGGAGGPLTVRSTNSTPASLLLESQDQADRLEIAPLTGGGAQSIETYLTGPGLVRADTTGGVVLLSPTTDVAASYLDATNAPCAYCVAHVQADGSLTWKVERDTVITWPDATLYHGFRLAGTQDGMAASATWNDAAAAILRHVSVYPYGDSIWVTVGSAAGSPAGKVLSIHVSEP